MAEVVVITGASAGVGRATARAFAASGADVALLARGKERLEDAQAEIERRQRRALVVPTDVSDPAQVEDAANRVEETLGPIDVWVNVAMTAVLLLIYLGNVASGAPPSVTAIWAAGIAGAIVLISWAWWVDQHREVIRQRAR